MLLFTLVEAFVVAVVAVVFESDEWAKAGFAWLDPALLFMIFLGGALPLRRVLAKLLLAELGSFTVGCLQ